MPITKTITHIELQCSSYTYNGDAKKPGVTVYAGEEMICSNATASNDKVKISYDSGRKLPGTYEVNVEGLGEYEGKISKSFKIKLATTEIRDLTKNTNCFNVKWKTKTDRQVTGYQVRYSKTSGMKNYTTKTVKSYKTGSLKVDGLQNGQKYYFTVKAIHKADADGNSKMSKRDSVWTINPDKKMIALTFDDGPGPYTQDIVDQLDKYNSSAPFFVVGNRVASYNSALKSAYVHGNEIGNHTWSHPILTYMSYSEIQSQIKWTDNAVKDVIGVKTKIMRPPGGAYNATVKSAVGKPIIYWSVDTLDWKTRSKAATINSVMNNASDGEIVLMHDIHYPTMEAALELISKLKNKGYQLVTVSELAKYRNGGMSKGNVYFEF